MTAINVFGDSISFGCWDEEGGWVERLKRLLDKKSIENLPTFWLLHNLSVSGDTTKYLLERFDAECEARLYEKDNEKEKNAIIFAIGSNDAAKGPLNIPPDKFQDNIRELIKKSKRWTSKIVFVGFTPCNPSPLQWSKNESYDNKDTKEYDDMLKAICKENNILFIDILADWIKKDYENWLIDGLHPNTEGHKKIFEVVKKALEQNKIISF